MPRSRVKLRFVFTKVTVVAGGKYPPKDIHVLFPGICEYVMLQGKGALRLWM